MGIDAIIQDVIINLHAKRHEIHTRYLYSIIQPPTHRGLAPAMFSC